jgi:aryl-alcohol dehydrogenase-like predicted oxidoreductase
MLFGESGPTLDFRGAARLMAAAAERGASFYDSSEMYPVPPSRETAGRSEEYLGRWAKEYGR